MDTALIKLTARQQEILDLVTRTIERTGSPPTRAEIATALGFRSANAAEEHLQALARKGAIELLGGTSRGIRLPGNTLRSVNAARLSRLAQPTGASGLGSAAKRLSQRVAQQLDLPIAGLAQLCLPLVGRVAAGQPILAQEHVENTFTVEAGLFQRKPDYLLRVRGLSMRDAGILDGDLLAVHKTTEARSGQIVVARLGDEVTVKRLHRSGGRVELLPENPQFQPIVVTAEVGDFAIEGVAVGLIRQTAWH